MGRNAGRIVSSKVSFDASNAWVMLFRSRMVEPLTANILSPTRSPAANARESACTDSTTKSPRMGRVPQEKPIESRFESDTSVEGIGTLPNDRETRSRFQSAGGEVGLGMLVWHSKRQFLLLAFRK